MKHIVPILLLLTAVLLTGCETHVVYVHRGPVVVTDGWNDRYPPEWNLGNYDQIVTTPKPNVIWNPGHWEKSNGHQRWINGKWIPSHHAQAWWAKQGYHQSFSYKMLKGQCE